MNERRNREIDIFFIYQGYCLFPRGNIYDLYLTFLEVQKTRIIRGIINRGNQSKKKVIKSSVIYDSQLIPIVSPGCGVRLKHPCEPLDDKTYLLKLMPKYARTRLYTAV